MQLEQPAAGFAVRRHEQGADLTEISPLGFAAAR